MKLTALPALALLTALASHAFAGPLKEAKINQIINEVKLVEPRQGARPAVLQELIKDDLGVATGVQSRAELIFQDNTLTRLGAETFFSFTPGTRDLNLERGSMLLQVPKNLGGARIRAASVTASITGTTVMVEYLAGNSIKLTVLEGSMDVVSRARPSDTLALRAGKMVIVNPDSKTLPTPVDVNLRTIMRDSVLANPTLFRGKSKLNIAALPSMDLIDWEIALQDAAAAIDAKVAVNAKPTTEASGSASPEKTATLIASNNTPALTSTTPLSEGTTTTTSPLSQPAASIPDPATPTPPPVTTPPPEVVVPPPTPTPPPVVVVPPPTPTPPPVVVVPPPVTVPTIPALSTPISLIPDLLATVPTGGTPIVPVHTLPANGPAYNLVKANITTGGIAPRLTAQPKQGNISMNGAIYAGPSIDGSASKFLFGATTQQDAQIHFDSRFGVNLEPAFPAAGVAAIRAASFNFDGAIPFNTTGGPIDVALISDAAIGVGGQVSPLALGGLRSFFVGTGNGSISMPTVSFTAPSTSGFRFLQIYARGATSTVTFGATVNTPGADLFVDAGANVVFSAPSALSAGSSVTVDRAVVNASGNVQALGSFTGNRVQFWSGAQTTIGGTLNAGEFYGLGNSLVVNGALNSTKIVLNLTGSLGSGAAGSVIKGADVSVTTGGALSLNATGTTATRFDLSTTTKFQAEAPAINLASHINLPAGATGSLKSTTGDITGATFSLGGFDAVESARDIKVLNLETRSLKAGRNVTVNGNLNVTNTDVTGWMWAGGTVSPLVGEAVTTLHVLKADSIQAVGGLNFKGAAGSLTKAPGAGHQAYLDVNQAIFSTSTGNGINGANFDGGDALAASGREGGDGGTLSVGTDLKPVAGKIDVNQPITASTGTNASGVATGGIGGSVNLVSNDTISVGAAVKVSDSTAGKASKQGGNIRVDGRKTTGTAIQVTSSGQLLSMLAGAAPGPGGKIEFVSAGGDILVNGGVVKADKGTVDIRNNGAAGRVQLTNATLSGDVVKVGALGANGQLIIGGGTISADTSLKLYGGSSNGSVRFTDNVTLGGASTKIIAGKTVEISSNKTVTIGGNSAAQVFADTANYTGSGGNGSTTGTFGGKGATTQGFSSRPAF